MYRVHVNVCHVDVHDISLLEFPEHVLRKNQINYLGHLELLEYLIHRDAGHRLRDRVPRCSTHRRARDRRASCAGSEHTEEVASDGTS